MTTMQWYGYATWDWLLSNKAIEMALMCVRNVTTVAVVLWLTVLWSSGVYMYLFGVIALARWLEGYHTFNVLDFEDVSQQCVIFNKGAMNSRMFYADDIYHLMNFISVLGGMGVV